MFGVIFQYINDSDVETACLPVWYGLHVCLGLDVNVILSCYIYKIILHLETLARSQPFSDAN